MSSLERKQIFLLFLVLLVIVVGNTGIWVMPNIDHQFTVSQNLLENPFPHKATHYLFTNYFQPLLFGVLGGNSFQAYIIYAFLTAALFLFVISYWHIKNNKDIAKYSILSMIVFPVFMLPFYWMGMDGMVLLLMVLAMINKNSKWGFIFAIFLGLQHFSQGLIGFSLLIFTLIIHSFAHKKNYKEIKHYIFIVLGVLLGKALLTAWFYAVGVEILGSRLVHLNTFLPIFSQQWVRSWPYILYSLFGVGWILIIFKIKQVWPLIVAALIVFILTFFVGDQTRVGVIILFPSLFYWVFLNKELLNSISPQFTMTMLIAYLLVPVVYVWGGGAFFDLWSFDKKAIQAEFNLDLSFPFNEENQDAYNISKMYIDRFEYNGSSLPTQVGRVLNQGLIAQESVEKPGNLTYGPYVQLSAGKYEFDLRYQSTMATTEHAGTWDVVIDNQTYLATGSIVGTDGLEGHIIKPFTVSKELSNKTLEIRNFYNGKGDLIIYHLKIEAIN